jgi:hypothetical protein
MWQEKNIVTPKNQVPGWLKFELNRINLKTKKISKHAFLKNFSCSQMRLCRKQLDISKIYLFNKISWEMIPQQVEEKKLVTHAILNISAILIYFFHQKRFCTIIFKSFYVICIKSHFVNIRKWALFTAPLIQLWVFWLFKYANLWHK